jgi:hypothetical protein
MVIEITKYNQAGMKIRLKWDDDFKGFMIYIIKDNGPRASCISRSPRSAEIWLQRMHVLPEIITKIREEMIDFQQSGINKTSKVNKVMII